MLWPILVKRKTVFLNAKLDVGENNFWFLVTWSDFYVPWKLDGLQAGQAHQNAHQTLQSQ